MYILPCIPSSSLFYSRFYWLVLHRCSCVAVAPEWGGALHSFGFGSTSSLQLVVFVSAFVMVSFLFAVLLLTVPPCPAICKVGVRAPVPYELAPLHTDPPPQKNLELRQKTASDDFVCVNWNRTARLRPSGILRSIAVGSGPLTNWPSTKDRFRWSMTRNERRRSRFAIKTSKRTCALSFRPF